MSESVSWSQVAEAGYVAYGKTTDNKNYQGKEMPTWNQLPPKIKEAWIAAAVEIGRSMGWLEGWDKPDWARP